MKRRVFVHEEREVIGALPKSSNSRPLALINLTVVSDCAIPAAEQDQAIEAIQSYAREANALDAITGALLFTSQHFVETLEGPAAAIDDLMARIEHDPRHSNVVIVNRQTITRRTFARWAIVYSGDSVFVARMVAAARWGDPVEVSRLLELLREFGTGFLRSHP